MKSRCLEATWVHSWKKLFRNEDHLSVVVSKRVIFCIFSRVDVFFSVNTENNPRRKHCSEPWVWFLADDDISILPGLPSYPTLHWFVMGTVPVFIVCCYWCWLVCFRQRWSLRAAQVASAHRAHTHKKSYMHVLEQRESFFLILCVFCANRQVSVCCFVFFTSTELTQATTPHV